MKFFLPFTFLIIGSYAFAQKNALNGKYIYDPLNKDYYFIFNSDSTFKFRLQQHLFHDIACGKWTTIKDTVFLTYISDIRDPTCNSEIGPNFPGDTGDVALRPKKLYFKNEKLYTIENRKITKSLNLNDIEIGPPYAWGFRRKYFLFGPYIKKHKDRYYMISESKVGQDKASR